MNDYENAQQSTQPEENGTAAKTFTQEEVNTIVRERLARERAKGAGDDLSARETDLKAREDALKAKTAEFDAWTAREACRKYLEENAQPPELLNILKDYTSDPEEFKKAAKVASLFAGSTRTAPIVLRGAKPAEGGRRVSVQTDDPLERAFGLKD